MKNKAKVDTPDPKMRSDNFPELTEIQEQMFMEKVGKIFLCCTLPVTSEVKHPDHHYQSIQGLYYTIIVEVDPLASYIPSKSSTWVIQGCCYMH